MDFNAKPSKLDSNTIILSPVKPIKLSRPTSPPIKSTRSSIQQQQQQQLQQPEQMIELKVSSEEKKRMLALLDEALATDLDITTLPKLRGLI
ncbi:MAG: hypothetical protein M1829_001312 [Trizodia sp. TS-e1964]|nr:MAG: hypothetical protein M1829_001312 [Trizodia sp. TS-e1964]